MKILRPLMLVIASPVGARLAGDETVGKADDDA